MLALKCSADRGRWRRLLECRIKCRRPGLLLCPMHCEQAALPMRGESGYAVRGKGSPPLCVVRQRREATGSAQCAGVARAVCRHAGVFCGSNLARGAGQNQPGADATARSPGAALLSPRHSIDIARAEDRGDNCECWPHTPRADCHQLLDGVPGHEAIARLDSAASHRVGVENRLR